MKSMTGFAQLERKNTGFSVKTSVKSINHRYLDLNLVLSDTVMPLEMDLRTLIQKKLERGKVDFMLKIIFEDEEPVSVKISRKAIESLAGELKSMAEESGLNPELGIKDLLMVPDIVRMEPSEIVLNPEQTGFVMRCTEEVLDKLGDMKEKEGGFLQSDFRERLKLLDRNMTAIETQSDGMISIYAEKLKERMGSLLSKADIQTVEDRITAEAALFADRSDISEEIVRTRSHLNQLFSLLDCVEPVGKKMDFIFQEMQREINTIGSKSRYINITEMVIQLKSELEKLREQIRNIE